MATKVFQIGFNKCGTRTIHQFLKKNGLRTIHWDDGNLARTMVQNLLDGRPLLRGYDENFDVFTDMEWVTREVIVEGFKLFPYLARDYPGARFILNTREREDWVKSRSGHGNGHYINKWKRASGLDPDALVEHWRQDWDHHHARVAEFFADKPGQLLKFHIANDPPQTIADFLPEHDIDASLYYQVGKTRSRAGDEDESDDVAELAGAED